jgi:hypothetical protein
LGTQSALADRLGVNRRVISAIIIEGRELKLDLLRQLYRFSKPPPDATDERSARLHTLLSQLTQAVVRKKYGAWADEEVWPSLPPTLSLEWLWNIILGSEDTPGVADTPHEALLRSDFPRGIYGAFVSVPTTLIKCGELLVRLKQPLWQPERSMSALRTTLETNKFLDWDYAYDIAVQYLGMLLNSAQFTITSTLDRCLRVWLERKLSRSADLPESFEARLRQGLAQILDVTEGTARDLFLSLAHGFNTYTTSSDVTDVIVQRADQFSAPLMQGMSLEELFTHLFRSDREQAACVALVAMRVVAQINAGADIARRGRQGAGYAIEWVATIHAALYIGAVWRAMLHDVFLRTG